MSLHWRDETCPDFAPGEDHISLRRNGKCYYVPQLFASSATFDVCVPLLICDLINSTDPRPIYGTTGSHLSNVVLVNNHPVRQVNVFGRIIGDAHRLFDGDNPSSHILLTLDDSSHATCLKMVVRVDERLHRLSMLSLGESYGKVVEVSGVVFRSYGSLRVLASRVFVHDGGLRDEILLWNERLEYRRLVLLRPWVFSPARVASSRLVDRLQYHDGVRRAQRRNLEISDRYTESLTSAEDSVPMALCRMRQGQTHANDIQLVHVEDNPVPVISMFLGALAVVRWIIRRHFKPVSLSEMYADPDIILVMNTLATYKISSQPLGVATDEPEAHIYDPRSADIEREMSKSFHSVRHYLQTECGLIVVSKRYHVYSTLLGKVHSDIVEHLHKLKTGQSDSEWFSVKEWVALQQHQAYSLDYKLVNGIIEHILSEDFHDRHMWVYSAKSTLWLYNCTVID